MLSELVYLGLIAAGFLALLVLKSGRFRDTGRKPSTPVIRRPAPSKELITAMAQRRVYSLKDVADVDQASAGHGGGVGGGGDDDDEYGQWAREFIAGTCAKLDAVQPDVLALETIVSEFCDRIDKILDTEEVRELYPSYV